MEVKINPGWNKWLSEEFEKPYFRELATFVREEYSRGICYPNGKDIFAAFDHCSPAELSVVILGQDPYHGKGQAHGLCFSVKDGIAVPPSLQNIFKEIRDDLGKPIPVSGNLQRWADQGVLLLNATLTVRANQAGSHQKKGWEQFTDAVIRVINEKTSGTVFMLWGNYAREKGSLVNRSRHLVLESAHPSPFSATRFFGNHHFSRCNAYLRKQGKTEIDW